MLKYVGVTVIVFMSLSLMVLKGVLKGDKNDLEDEVPEITIYDPIVVLELFTSQGCSSCPSADIPLTKVKKEFQKEVYALSYHGEYWNYFG